jgi:hypothetical protein
MEIPDVLKNLIMFNIDQHYNKFAYVTHLADYNNC